MAQFLWAAWGETENQGRTGLCACDVGSPALLIMPNWHRLGRRKGDSDKCHCKNLRLHKQMVDSMVFGWFIFKVWPIEKPVYLMIHDLVMFCSNNEYWPNQTIWLSQWQLYRPATIHVHTAHHLMHRRFLHYSFFPPAMPVHLYFKRLEVGCL